MTFIDWLMLLPMWGKVLVGLLGVEAFVMLGLLSFRSVLMTRRMAEEVDLMRQLVQEVQAAKKGVEQSTHTLSLVLGMWISERNKRQEDEAAREDVRTIE